jgi:hypothetical protein
VVLVLLLTCPLPLLLLPLLLLLLLLSGLKPDQTLHLKALARRGKAHEGLKQHGKALQVT